MTNKTLKYKLKVLAEELAMKGYTDAPVDIALAIEGLERAAEMETKLFRITEAVKKVAALPQATHTQRGPDWETQHRAWKELREAIAMPVAGDSTHDFKEGELVEWPVGDASGRSFLMAGIIVKKVSEAAAEMPGQTPGRYCRLMYPDHQYIVPAGFEGWPEDGLLVEANGRTPNDPKRLYIVPIKEARFVF